MKETRSGGALVTTIAGLVLLMLAGGWLGWGRGAWNRYQIRGLLRGAIEAYQAGDDMTAERLQSRAGERTNLNALPPGPERELYHQLRAILVRRAYEEQLKRERQD